MKRGRWFGDNNFYENYPHKWNKVSDSTLRKCPRQLGTGEITPLVPVEQLREWFPNCPDV